ncbi:MAG TPA: glycosyltransferase family 4 protein, partial [Thermoanaerobaculia bacterium]|nr:glycosyltransferase family 4 protein [Thermoanaerobaculia bacterium]
MSARVLLVNSQIPFARGGAESLVAALGAALAERGFEVDRVALPFSLSSREQLVRSAMAWRMLDLAAVEGRPIDLVIATRFPSYLVRHPNKVVWLIHQLRQVYDLAGSRYSDFDDSPRDRRAAEMVRRMDRRGLGEARRLFAISKNVAARLERHNGLTAEALYPPSPLAELLAGAAAEEAADDAVEAAPYVFTAGRLVRPKRFDLLIEALAKSGGGWTAVVAGTGPEAAALARLAAERGVADRVRFAGWAADAEVARLYRRCRAVYFAPFDEDYGYVTVEAMRAGKPVVTTADAGGALEFVADGVNGLVAEPSPRAVAAALDRLAEPAGERGIAGQAVEGGGDGTRRRLGDQAVDAVGD